MKIFLIGLLFSVSISAFADALPSVIKKMNLTKNWAAQSVTLKDGVLRVVLKPERKWVTEELTDSLFHHYLCFSVIGNPSAWKKIRADRFELVVLKTFESGNSYDSGYALKGGKKICAKMADMPGEESRKFLWDNIERI